MRGGCNYCTWALSSFRRIKVRKRKNTGFIICFEQEQKKAEKMKILDS